LVRTIEKAVTRREEREWSAYTGSRVGCGALDEEEILKEKALGRKMQGSSRGRVASARSLLRVKEG
jgi:hypothetical protein